MNNFYVYKHLKKDDGEVFYIGMGSGRRCYNKNGRSKFWSNVYNKHDIIVKIVKDNLTSDEAKKLEIELISKYGRRDLGTGILVNQGPGGDNIWNYGLVKEKQPRYGCKNNETQRKAAKENSTNNNCMKNIDIVNKMIKSKTGIKWDNKDKRIKYIIVEKDGIELGIFHGVKEISEKFNLVYGSITSVLCGARASVYGYKIKYL